MPRGGDRAGDRKQLPLALQRELARMKQDYAELEERAQARGVQLMKFEGKLIEQRERLEGELENLRELIAFMESTRIWRWGTSYWRIRDRFLRRRPR